MPDKPRLLFVCGRNQWRSPTAEWLYRHDERVEVRSAGTSAVSRHRVSAADIQWADLILVMETKYRTWIVTNFRTIKLPPIENLDVPDEYGYLDEELIGLLPRSGEPHIVRLTRPDRM
jgi:predicted protein tyrosine phosphatase